MRLVGFLEDYLHMFPDLIPPGLLHCFYIRYYILKLVCRSENNLKLKINRKED